MTQGDLRTWRQRLNESFSGRFPYGALLALLAMLVAAPALAPAFLQPQNLANILGQIAVTGTIALGMTVVMATGGIDLSVGAVLALISVLAAGTQAHGTWVVVAMAMGVGTFVGVINGAGVTYGRAQPFVMTLAVMTAVRGVAFMYSRGVSVPIDVQGLERFGAATIAGLPASGIAWAVMAVPLAVFMARAPGGRQIYAIGSNLEAARAVGVSVTRHVIGAYVLSGLLAAAAGILFVAQQGVGMPLAGVGYELNAIVAAVLGGASLMGGSGTVLGTCLGAAALGIMGNVMNLSGVSPFAQDILKGLIIVGVVLLRGTGHVTAGKSGASA